MCVLKFGYSSFECFFPLLHFSLLTFVIPDFLWQFGEIFYFTMHHVQRQQLVYFVIYSLVLKKGYLGVGVGGWLEQLSHTFDKST